MAPKDRDIAMVFQNYALYPHMSVYDNMAFGLRRRKLPPTRWTARCAAPRTRWASRPTWTRKPRELSGGQRQRVALGRAMVRDPQVFLFDEPLSNLDAKLRVQMRAEIKRLHQRVNATMVYVTHDQIEAMTLGDRIAVLHRGLLQQVADPFTLYSRPGQPVRGRLHRQPADQLLRRRPRRGRHDADAAAASPSRCPPTWPRPRAAARPERDAGRAARGPAAGRRGPGVTLEGTVDVREPLGSEVLVHLDTPVGPLVARYPGQHVPGVGSKAKLHFSFEKLYCFDPDTELALKGAE